MSATDFLDIAIHIIFISLGVLAIVDYLRHRNGIRRDIALMFGVLAIPFLLQLIARMRGEEVSPAAQILSVTALVLEPYLLLRLVRYLRSMPVYMTRLAGFSMLATILTGVVFGPRVPLITALVSQAYLIGFNLYAMVGFARAVLRSSGVQQQRLRFAAAGSGFFALIFVGTSLSSAISLPKDFTLLLLEGLAGACVITYYIGFAPPRWLRQTWQFDELHHFLNRTSNRLEYDHTITFEQLSTAALRTVGGVAALVAECDMDGKKLRLEPGGDPPFQIENLDAGLDAIGKAWKEQKADVVQVSKDLGAEMNRWVQSFNAQALFLMPIKGAVHPWGLLIVVLQNAPLFPQDDLDLLALLAEQSAIQLDHAALNQELQDNNQLLEQRFSERTAELAISERNYRDLADSAPIGIFRSTLKGEILYINEKLAHIIGFDSPQAMIDSGAVTRWKNPGDRQAFIELLQRQGEVASAEIEIVRANGEPFPILISARLRGDMLTGTIMDITERKQAEEALQIYNAKLEQSNRDLQEFAYVASHDLQEPLRKVQAFSDRLATKYTNVLDESGRDYLMRMRDASQRMQVLINDLLSLSRVATRAEPFVNVDLNKVAKNVISDLENQIERAEGHVEIGELPIIESDQTKMHHILQNLICNALKFHLEGHPPHIKISAKIKGTAYQISIADNGIGFDIQYLDRIFKPFQRLHNREEFEGSGMGLAICRRIVERHRGTITATSAPGEGATFILILPIHQPKEKLDATV